MFLSAVPVLHGSRKFDAGRAQASSGVMEPRAVSNVEQIVDDHEQAMEAAVSDVAQIVDSHEEVAGEESDLEIVGEYAIDELTDEGSSADVELSGSRRRRRRRRSPSCSGFGDKGSRMEIFARTELKCISTDALCHYHNSQFTVGTLYTKGMTTAAYSNAEASMGAETSAYSGKVKAQTGLDVSRYAKFSLYSSSTRSYNVEQHQAGDICYEQIRLRLYNGCNQMVGEFGSELMVQDKCAGGVKHTKYY